MTIANTQSQWLAAAKLLGLDIAHTASDRAPCPFCDSGEMRIFADSILGGLYFAGDQCFPHGDLVDLFARKFDLDRDAALRRLMDVAPSMSLTYTGQADFRDEIADGRKLIDAIWDAAMPLSHAVNHDAFRDILRNRAMPFEARLSWHPRNLECQFRAIAADDLQNIVTGGIKRSLQEITFGHPRCPRNMYLISRLYSLPGQVTGMQLSTTGFNNKLVEHFQFVSEDCYEAGLAIHPDNISQANGIILCSSASWSVKAAFVHGNKSETLNPFATLIKHGKFQTTSLQALRHRPVVMWAGRLTPQVLNAAVGLNAQITNFGADETGKIRGDTLKHLQFENIPEVLTRYAKSWQDQILVFGRNSSPDAMFSLLEKSKLDLQTIEEIAEIISPAEKNLFVERFFSPCPLSYATSSRGNVEQRRNGWVHVRRGHETTICNKCWRVRSIEYQDLGRVVAVLEILDSDQWHRAEVDYTQLTQSPWKSIQRACVQLKLSPFTFDPAWQTRALHIASQLHPVIESKKSQALGVDLSARVVRLTRAQISLDDGTIETVAPISNQSLLPLAGRELPSKKAVQSIIQHRGLQKALSALVYQLTSHLRGMDEVAVIGSGQFSKLSSQLLQATGFADHSCAISIRQQSPGEHIDLAQANSLRANVPVWATAGPDVANWLAGVRPTIYLGHKCVVSLPVTEHHLQRCLLRLLANTLREVQAGQPLASAVDSAWRALIGQLRINIDLDGLEREVPIDRVDALGYFISKAIVTGSLTAYQRQPQIFKSDSYYYERRTPRFSINRVTINSVLKKLGAPLWDLTELERDVLGHPHFHAAITYGRSVVWRFGSEILSKAANTYLFGQQQLSVVGRPDDPATAAG